MTICFSANSNRFKLIFELAFLGVLLIGLNFRMQGQPLNTTLFWDESGDNYISNNEIGCVKYYFSNSQILGEDAFSFKSGDNRIMFVGPPQFYKFVNARWELAVSIVGTGIQDSTPISFTITQTHNGKTKTLKEVSIKTKAELFNRSALSKNFQNPNLGGIWMSQYYGTAYILRPDGSYKRETSVNCKKIIKQGNWYHYINNCYEEEYLSFSGMKSGSRYPEINEIPSFWHKILSRFNTSRYKFLKTNFPIVLKRYTPSAQCLFQARSRRYQI